MIVYCEKAIDEGGGGGGGAGPEGAIALNLILINSGLFSIGKKAN
jgi:hypothetical protein